MQQAERGHRRIVQLCLRADASFKVGRQPRIAPAIQRSIPHTESALSERAEATGQDGDQVLINPAPPDHLDRLLPLHDPMSAYSIPQIDQFLPRDQQLCNLNGCVEIVFVLLYGLVILSPSRDSGAQRLGGTNG